jgi:hypothetical protein
MLWMLTCRVLGGWLDRKHIAAIGWRWTIWTWWPVSFRTLSWRVTQVRAELIISSCCRCRLTVRGKITGGLRSGVQFRDIGLRHVVIVYGDALECYFPACRQSCRWCQLTTRWWRDVTAGQDVSEGLEDGTVVVVGVVFPVVPVETGVVHGSGGGDSLQEESETKNTIDLSDNHHSPLYNSDLWSALAAVRPPPLK